MPSEGCNDYRRAEHGIDDQSSKDNEAAVVDDALGGRGNDLCSRKYGFRLCFESCIECSWVLTFR